MFVSHTLLPFLSRRILFNKVLRIFSSLRFLNNGSSKINYIAGQTYSIRFMPFTFIPTRSIQLGSQLNNEIATTGECWKCMKKLKGEQYFCEHCKVIQRPHEKNYFELFHLNLNFDVNEIDLSKSLKNMQRLFHPDKFSLSSPEELSIAEEYSSLLNRAYSILRQPWSRGVYLLSVLGVEVDEDTTVDDPDLLMTVMERNEAVAEAKSPSVIFALDKENKKDMIGVIKNISSAFEKKDLKNAEKLLHKLKYFSNIDDKINEKKLDFGLHN